MAIGQKLEEARNRKGISLREASESTKIRGDYLTAFESSSFDINLPEVYLRGFVRLYARFLDLDQEADLLDTSVQKVLDDGLRTKDIMSDGKKEVTTADMGDAIISKLK